MEAGKQYEVRLNKRGFETAAPAAAVEAKKGAASVMDMSLEQM